MRWLLVVSIALTLFWFHGVPLYRKRSFLRSCAPVSGQEFLRSCGVAPDREVDVLFLRNKLAALYKVPAEFIVAEIRISRLQLLVNPVERDWTLGVLSNQVDFSEVGEEIKFDKMTVAEWIQLRLRYTMEMHEDIEDWALPGKA